MAVPLQAAGQPLPPPLPTFYDALSCDDDSALRAIAAITSGVAGIADKAAALLAEWERKYKRVRTGRLRTRSQCSAGCSAAEQPRGPRASACSCQLPPA
jgi:hypothetical protein